MFNVLDKQTFTVLSRSGDGPATSVNKNFNQKQIKLKNIVGARVRSKNGCLNCKRRKYVGWLAPLDPWDVDTNC